ncbi:MAG: hypothetical protein GY866_29210 [Proteobacteria bacterium]|nr:hypothetical protein [Pseudomonadota bacterium]
MVFEPLLSGGSFGKMTLSSLLSIPHGIVVLIVVMIALATFFFLGKIEGLLYKKADVS